MRGVIVLTVLTLSAQTNAEVALADASFQEQVQRIAAEVEPMMTHPKLQGHAKVIVEEVEKSMANPTFEKRAQRLTEEMEAMVADPSLQQQAKAVMQKVQAMEANSVVKQVEAMVSSPSFQKQALRIAEQVQALEADPQYQKQARLTAEQMEAMMAATQEPDFKRQAQRVAQELKALMTKDQSAAPSLPVNTQDPVDDLLDNLLDNIVDNIFDSALQASPADAEDMKDMTLAYPKSLTIPRLRGLTRPRPALLPTSAQKQVGGQRAPVMMSRNDRSTFPSEPESSSKNTAGFEALDSKPALRPWKNVHKEMDKISQQAFTTALAVTLMLAPQAAWAEEAAQQLSPFQKVDKTGFIGGIASVIEQGIDTSQAGLQSFGVQANTYGISICLFTVLIRVLTLPLTQTQLESSVKMQQIAPLQKKIQAAFPNPEQEAMKSQYLQQLFQSAQVNPLAGCLPAVIQIPVFISLYRALTNLCAEDKLTESFLWLPSLEGPTYGQAGNAWFSSIFTGNPTLGWDDTRAFLTLPAILVVTQSYSSKLLQPPRDPKAPITPQEQTSQNIANFLPLMIAAFSLNVPAGLSVYWIANNILTTAITLGVKAGIKSDDLPQEVTELMAQIESGGSTAAGAVGGNRAARRSQDGVVDAEMEEIAPVRISKKKSKKGKKFREIQQREAQQKDAGDA